MILEYSSLVFGLEKEFCGTVKNLQPLNAIIMAGDED
jgi:hypothetical protein